MTIRHLRIFAAVYRFNSITKAAGYLYMTQPAVSLAIKELEEYYGLKLFDRMSRGIQITESGKFLLEYAIHIVDLFDDMELALKNPDPVGEIKIGSSLSIGARLLPDYIAQLKLLYPSIRARVLVDNSQSIIQAVAEGHLDIGLVEGSVDNNSLIIIPFMEDFLIPVCGKDHPFSQKKAVSLDEFLSQPLLMRERGSGVRELFDSALAVWGKQAEPLWESASTTALISALEAGFGVSMLPEMLMSEPIRQNRVCRVPLDADSVKRSFYLIHHHKKYLSNAIRSFWHIVTDKPVK